VPKRAILFAVALAFCSSCRDSDSRIDRIPQVDSSPQSDAGAEMLSDADASAAVPECQLVPPPRIVLSSKVGEQVGVEGGYCGGACAASVRCADRPILVARFTVVRPGDELTISAPEAQLLPGERCQPACPPRVRIAPVCDRREEAVTLVFQEDVAWPIELPDGIYAVEVETHADADSGWRGSLGYGFGLVVDPERPRAIVEASDFDSECESR
jgi:hypothetical protein